MKKKANITDAFGRDVFFGDEFDAYMIRPSLVAPTKVRVVIDESEENLSFDRNYDVEDEKGNRLWNAFMVIKNNDYQWDGGIEALRLQYKELDSTPPATEGKDAND